MKFATSVPYVYICNMTTEEYKNPFVLIGYVEPKLFCDRLSELSRLEEVYMNDRQLVLLSQRRVGKTALLKHFFYKLKDNKKVIPVLVDIYSTETIEDFINVLAKEVLNKFDGLSTKVFKGFTKFFSSFNPSLSIDPLSGETIVSFKVNSDSEAKITLEHIFAYLRKQKKKIIIAFDEFQEIRNYPSENTEAVLRTLLQKYNDFTCIFSGSKRHMLIDMFENTDKPFYKSAEMMHLGLIPKTKYIKFIKGHFSKTDISETDIEYIIDWCRGYTFYVQTICNRIYSLKLKKVDRSIINSIFVSILKENENVYLDYKNLLAPLQFKLLEAIAKNEGVKEPTSSEFTQKYRLGAASSVQRALKAMIDKQMVYYEDGVYSLLDIFFEKWLVRY